MFIVMETTATREMVARVCKEVEKLGLTAHPIPGAQRTAIGVTGNKERVDSTRILTLKGVQEIVQVTKPYKLVARESHPEDTVVDINGVKVGGEAFVVMAGPCSIENREQALAIAEQVAESGARVFRGGAFKPRTSPYSFQGLGKPGLEILAQVGRKFGLATVTEAIDTETIELVAEYADIVQIGARNMQNYSLLRKAGRTKKPILLKRGMSATVLELLMAAEYIMAEGNRNVILCERGIRTFTDQTHNILDLSAIPQVKRMSHLPIIVDPSHGSGRRYKVQPLSRAAIAVGADGLLVEVHHRPEEALSDGAQAITPEDFSALMDDMRKLAPVLNRTVT